MPRKIREIERDLLAAGFKRWPGKGSHRNYVHPSGTSMTVSGASGADAKPYQEREAMRKIKESQS